MELNAETIKYAVTIITALGTFFFKERILTALNIKKEENNVAGGTLDNIQQSLDIWQEMLDDAVKRHKDQVAQLEGIIKKLESIIKEQNELIYRQQKQLTDYERKFGKIKNNE